MRCFSRQNGLLRCSRSGIRSIKCAGYSAINRCNDVSADFVGTSRPDGIRHPVLKRVLILGQQVNLRLGAMD